MLTNAEATRTDGLLTIRIIGQSLSPCDEATIVGYYPGTIKYSNDPCSAQIFIREGRKPELENMHCPPVWGKLWILNQVIRDNYHKTIEIFVNNNLTKKIRIIELEEKGLYNIWGI
ncbi:MAG: hypothetical protein Q8934_10090 [Bacillota bacterium]|nr:hypothetical protein [Bacillota bacterium]